MNRPLSIVSCAAIVAALATAHDARADNAASASHASAQSDAERESAAQRHYLEGLRFYDLAVLKNHNRGLFEQAYAEFKTSVDTRPNGKRYWNLAVSEIETERWLEALDHFRQSDASEHISSADHRFHKRYLDCLAKADLALGHLEVTAREGAAIVVDNKPAGVAPLATPVRVAPGGHTVTVEGHDYSRTVKAGETEKINAIVVVPPPILSVPETEAKASDQTPKDVVVAPHVTPTPPLEAPSRAPQLLVSGSLVAGAAVAGIVGALYENAAESNKVKATSLLSSYRTPSQACAPTSTTAVCASVGHYRSSYKTDAVLAPVMFSGAGLLGALGVASFFILAPHGQEQAAMVVPVITPTTVGLALDAHF